MTQYRIVEVPEYEAEPTYTIQVRKYISALHSYKYWYDVEVGIKSLDEARETMKRLEFNSTRQVKVVG